MQPEQAVCRAGCLEVKKMKRAMPPLVHRQAATEKTIKRYDGKAFDWGAGITCVHLARFHLRNMGHRPPTLPRFRSALMARRAMQERGWGSVAEMLDSMLPRIAPAQMILGDMAILPGDGMDAILICVGPRRLFGWHEDSEVPVMQEPDISKVVGAWHG